MTDMAQIDGPAEFSGCNVQTIFEAGDAVPDWIFSLSATKGTPAARFLKRCVFTSTAEGRVLRALEGGEDGMVYIENDGCENTRVNGNGLHLVRFDEPAIERA